MSRALAMISSIVVARTEEGGGFWLVTHNPEQGVVKTHIPRKMVRIGMALAGSIAREDSLAGRLFGKKG